MQTVGRTTMKAGTPAFQPPEQLKGEEVGPACDVYAVGCILLELFGESPIWAGLAAHTILLKVAVQGEYPSFTHTSPQIHNLLRHCFTESKQRGSAIEILDIVCDIALKYC